MKYIINKMMKYTIILLFICLPILGYYYMQYGLWTKDSSERAVQIKLKHCEVDQKGNDRQGHNIDYYEKNADDNRLITNIIWYVTLLDLILIVFLFYLKYRRKSNVVN